MRKKIIGTVHPEVKYQFQGEGICYVPINSPLGLSIDPGLGSLYWEGEAVHDHHDVGVHFTQQQPHHF